MSKNIYEVTYEITYHRKKRVEADSPEEAQRIIEEVWKYSANAIGVVPGTIRMLGTDKVLEAK